ncbi:lysozyme family protein [Roseiarcus fermentans]|uniref:Lysozyme family protein n=1 Tax=Roseiarcus fermentans TaxID=1473586 RepID=A0A366FSK5_9HYPH|nr:peptidoglycan-binding protein [Roseiarcus fermentans]RBP17511.1 lysozyme family protein [Roseiarcus fermentans]
MANLETLFQKYRSDYEVNWQAMQIRPGSVGEASKAASRLLRNKTVYQQIEAITDVPWPFIGLCHDRESGFDLNTYLGNGQPLNRVTTIVPKGRGPFTGPNAFIDGAVDALRIQGFVGATDWSLARTLFRLEAFNGFGYHSRGVQSPYLWSGSTVYGPPEARAGKFVSDGVFDPGVVDPQLGVAVILKELIGLDPSIVFGAAPSAPSVSPEPDVSLAEDVLHVQHALNVLGIVPSLVEDGILGPRTKAAISAFQEQDGLNDTGLPDAATVAAIAEETVRRSAAAKPMLPAPQKPMLPATTGDILSQIVQRIEALERTPLPATPIAIPGPAAANPNDPVGAFQRILDIVRRIQPPTGATAVVSANHSADQFKQAIDILNALVGSGGQPLGPVNGALGETLGNLLNGRKTAIGIGGSLATSLLAAVPFSSNAGGLAGLLGTVATSVPGLSQAALPLFLAMTAWGVLGKFEKWSQAGALPTVPQA